VMKSQSSPSPMSPTKSKRSNYRCSQTYPRGWSWTPGFLRDPPLQIVPLDPCSPNQPMEIFPRFTRRRSAIVYIPLMCARLCFGTQIQPHCTYRRNRSFRSKRLCILYASCKTNR
jgi:hypothetical protein